jgi:predicted dehydrogenase
MNELRVALIGLDTSHSIEFARRMQAPDCPENQRVAAMRATACLRFQTPFQNADGLNTRQAQLESWGVRVTENFDEAIEGCDALLLEINDPQFHLEYFARCAALNKPIFLDKPLADSLENGRAIMEIARQQDTKFFSASSLRFVPQLSAACEALPAPKFASLFGPLGDAPSGSAIVWYGVHTFEMLQRAMGRGAQSVFVKRDESGITAIVQYPNGRRGVVELANGAYVYGGSLRDDSRAVSFVADMSRAYSDVLVLIEKFFRTGEAPVETEDTLEIMALLDAAERAAQSGKEEVLFPEVLYLRKVKYSP